MSGGGKRKGRVLVVDDERNTREGLRMALGEEYEVATAENGAAALQWLEGHAADVVLTDLRMPGVDGMELLTRLKGRAGGAAVIMLTAYGNIETAVEAMRRGAYDFLPKPVDLERLDALVGRAMAERRAGEAAAADASGAEGPEGPGGILGGSAAMQGVYAVIRQAGPSRATVLIQGESGTGKELVARALHECSPRKGKPFVAVNFAALAPTLIETELFGSEKGAYTGATERRKGRFELANGGTLFLDEVGEISLEMQVKLLRVLETRSFERVGGGETLKTDVRVVAATNRDLKAMVKEGKFREDLFYRLYVINVTMPPLRERGRADILQLAEHYLAVSAAANGKPKPRLGAGAADALAAYAWPGNVRELQNLMEKCVVLHDGPVLEAEDLPAEVREGRGADGNGGSLVRNESSHSGGALAEARGEAEKERVEAALARAGGRRGAAAAELGVSVRTLQRMLKKYGLGGGKNGGGDESEA